MHIHLLNVSVCRYIYKFVGTCKPTSTATGRCKSLMQRWGYEDGEATCDCGEEQTMEHLLICPLLPEPCTLEDLEALNDQAKACVQHWTGTCVATREEEEEPTSMSFVPTKYLMYRQNIERNSSLRM